MKKVTIPLSEVSAGQTILILDEGEEVYVQNDIDILQDQVRILKDKIKTTEKRVVDEVIELIEMNTEYELIPKYDYPRPEYIRLELIEELKQKYGVK